MGLLFQTYSFCMVAKSGKKAHAYLHRASVNNYLGLLLIVSGVARGGGHGGHAPPQTFGGEFSNYRI